MRTILHIGQHKTGTTSIQHFMRDNQAMLIEQGFYYPKEVAGVQTPSHFVLNLYSLAKGRRTSIMDELTVKHGERYLTSLMGSLENKIVDSVAHIYDQAKDHGCHTVVFSNEGLYILNSVEEYQSLQVLLSPYSSHIEVLCCFRDVKAYRKSYMRELKRQQLTPSSDPNSYRYVRPNSFLFNYERKKELLEQVFHKCSYFNYDPSDNIRAFLEAIGFKGAPSTTPSIRKNDYPSRWSNLRSKIFNLFQSK